MNHIYITDCTIRDGGYLLNKNSDPVYIRGIMQGLARAGIDFVETGFLQDKVSGETLVYANSKDVVKYLPADKGTTNFLGFCDNSRYSNENLDVYDGQSFKWLRISFAKHELEKALVFCKQATEKGYLVQFNPMDAISYTDEERAALIKQVNLVQPVSLSIVDTFGAMYLDDLIHIFKHIDSLLDKDIKIGLHSHDNLGLSTALAEVMILLSKERNRDIIVDGSLMGMGRGAGNASTELIASYLNEKCGAHYNIPALLETIEKYILPLQKNIHWGYDLPMYVCGVSHAHVDNIYHLQKQGIQSTKDMYEIIRSMPVEKRTRYGAGYVKSNFDDLEQATSKYFKRK